MKKILYSNLCKLAKFPWICYARKIPLGEGDCLRYSEVKVLDQKCRKLVEIAKLDQDD
jgi:hypothetical protein